MTLVAERSTQLNEIAAKVQRGQRLDLADGVALYASRDIHEIGWPISFASACTATSLTTTSIDTSIIRIIAC